MKLPKFNTSESSEFTRTLRSRVNQYFKETKKSKYGNRKIIIKTIVMLAAFFIPLGILSSGIVTSIPLLFGLYIMSGLGMAGIGMGVMHDAIHGSFSENPRVNRIMGYTMNLIGANDKVWKIQHNVLHHTYTNIDQADDDINSPFFLRFSPNAKHYWLHQFQYIYVWLFYALSTVSWITVKDFVRLKRYRKMGFFNKPREFRQVMIKMMMWKVLYYSYALILPLIFVPLPFWLVLIAFLSMHLVTGLCISIVFQTAHIMPNTSFPVADGKEKMTTEWMEHQLLTTSNYAPRNKVLSWLIGGLNYQVEHHLFPNISHVHYRSLSPIVAATAREFGMPYNMKKTFISAIAAHVRMLRRLGQKDQISM